jgi:hypothetical protein
MKSNDESEIGFGAGVLSLMLFFLSLCFPALYIGGGEKPSEAYGFAVLLLGWLGLPWPIYLPWLANPLLMICILLLFFRNFDKAIYLGAAALAFGIASFFVSEVPSSSREEKIVGYGVGFFLWLSAIGLSFGASLYMRFASKKGAQH